jgi:hypothetical protein
VFVNWRRQGDIGEASAIEWLTLKGYAIAIPFGHSPDWDLIGERGDVLSRIQVKTCTYRNPKGRWAVAICTRGGNQSWTGLVKRFDSSRCDYLFVHVADGRRWFVPAERVEGGNVIVLGGPKYSEYEIEKGARLPDPATVDQAA